jgi:predicted enzyme related to lactoylglutathione lyase
MKLSGVMIGSEQPKVLGEFYTKVLGEPGFQQDDWYGFHVDGGNLMVGSHSEVKGSNKNPERIMFNFETDEVVKEFERIKGLGGTVVAEPYHPSKDDDTIWLATLADPDGNYFQLATPWKS